LFNSVAHIQRVAQVDDILCTLLASYKQTYRTRRSATRNRPAHTEVKYMNVVQYSSTLHTIRRREAVDKLTAMGLDIVYKPKTNSYSVHVS
jgi:hypothetical protein